MRAPFVLSCSGRRSALLSAVLSLAIAAAASPATAADDATLRLSHGPDHTGSLTITALRFVLDGKPLTTEAPAAGAHGARLVYTGAVARGVHRLEVEASLEGNSAVFTYTDGYRFKLRAALDLEVLAGESVDVRSAITRTGNLTVPWEERFRIVLTLSSPNRPPAPPSAPADVAAEPAPVVAAASPAQAAAAVSPAPRAAEPTRTPAAKPVPAPPPERTPARAQAPSRAAPTPAPPPSPSKPSPQAARPKAAGSGPCVLEPIHFPFDSSVLPADARPPLDAFAACIAGTATPIRLEGHGDARGTVEFNVWIADERARAVAAYLRERGVDAARITTQYKGKSSPVCTEATEPCFARNRRVEVVPGD